MSPHKRPIPRNIANHRPQNMSKAITIALTTRTNPTRKMVNRGKVDLVARKQHVDPKLLTKALEDRGYKVN